MNFQHFLGALSGLAVGDALGTTLEFREPGSFEPLEDMVGGGPFRLKPGEWTDDTSMALCLAASLVEQDTFDPRDQMDRYLRWYREGYFSSTGTCFDIGNTVRGALERYERGDSDGFAGLLDPDTAGNGSLMRVAPVALRYAGSPERALRLAADSSKTTHGARTAVDACRYFCGLLVGALQGKEKEELLSPLFCPIPGFFDYEPLTCPIAVVAKGSFKEKMPPQIRGTGYVVESLEAALWAFHQSSTFREGALLAVNLGNDADTTGAIYGQIAGAFYGEDQIPTSWLEKTARIDEIRALARGLYERSS